MIRPPAFWAENGWPARLLGPLGAITQAIGTRRDRIAGWHPPVPVFCCGNATMGGAGKTTLALDLGARLVARGIGVQFLSRGYGGRVRGPWRVSASHQDAAQVGDEPLLLARVAPCWVGADRRLTALSAIACGAQALVMDDGLQNRLLTGLRSALVIDGATGFGNGRLFPAGPLREPVASAAARCDIAVMIGDDATHARAALPPHLPVLQAQLALRPDDAQWLAGRAVFALAAIARPGKFHASLRAAGAHLAGHADYADHHRFHPAELERFLARAHALNAAPVTTAKDAVRLPPEIRARVRVIGVDLVWREPGEIETWLTTA